MNHLFMGVTALKNMVLRMYEKNLDLRRITKTASLLLMSGLNRVSIPKPIVQRCLREQRNDGGWVGNADTMWNVKLLTLIDPEEYKSEIDNALKYLQLNKNNENLWGRSQRDISRIPITGLMLHMLTRLADDETLFLLEKLWVSEMNSITYKAAYTLMSFNSNQYFSRNESLTEKTIAWLAENQEDDGGFSPWKGHPVRSDVFCTGVATLGLLQYPDYVRKDTLEKSCEWLKTNQRPDGIWEFHEIEDGASWGVAALNALHRNGFY